jgi:hypothetical protein
MAARRVRMYYWQQWIELHYGPRNERFNPEAVNLTGTAGCGPACQACRAEALAEADLSRHSLGGGGWCGSREANPPGDPIRRYHRTFLSTHSIESLLKLSVFVPLSLIRIASGETFSRVPDALSTPCIYTVTGVPCVHCK